MKPSRRIVAVVAVLIASILGACTGNQAPPSGVSPHPGGGGTLQIGNTADPVFNWFQESSLPSLYMQKVFYNSLTRLNEETLAPEPDLATEWESSEDATIWTFHLRRDVTWHDGTPFTAEDVRFTYETITAPDSLRRESRLDAISEIQVLDPHTVQFTLTKPVAPAPLNLSFNIPILPKHRFENVDLKSDTSFNEKPIGTGPYKFVEQVRGSHVILDANPDYFRGRPPIDRIVFKIVPDVNTQVALLRTGELDVAVVEPTHLRAIENDPNITINAAEGTTYFYFAMNTRKDIFSDRRVRQAMGLSLDRQSMIDSVLGGQATIGIGPVPPALSEYFNGDLAPRPYDPAEAQRLLAEAGWVERNAEGILVKDGKPFKVSVLTDRGNPTRERVAALAQQYWKEVGIDVEIDAKEWASYVTTYQSDYDEETGVRSWDMVLGWIGLAPDPDGTREYHSTPARVEGSRWGYRNPAVDELLEEGLAELNPVKRAQIYRDFQALVYEEAPVVYLYYPKELTAHRTRVKGMPNVGGLRVTLAHIEKWSLEGQ